MLKKDIPPTPKSKLKSSVQRSIRQTVLSTYPLLAPHLDELLPKKASLSSMKLPNRGTLFVLGSEPLFFYPTASSGDGPILPHLRLVHRFPHAFPSIRIDRGAIRFVLSGATLMAPGLTSSGGRLPLPRDPPVEEEKKKKAKNKNENDPSAEAGGGAGDGTEGAAAVNEGEAAEAAAEQEGGEQENDDDDEEEDGLRKEWGADEEGRWWRELEKGEPVVIMAEGKEEACAVGVLAMGTAEIKEKGKGPAMEDPHFIGDGLWKMNTG